MLSEIFDPKRINLDLLSKTKSDVLKELVTAINASDSKLDRQELLNAIVMRENKMNTIILPGVAVPHGYCNTVDGVIGVVGVSRGGIEFDRQDRHPVHLFFLLIMDESSKERHLRVLSRLLEMINSTALGEIRDTGTPQKLYELLCRF